MKVKIDGFGEFDEETRRLVFQGMKLKLTRERDVPPEYLEPFDNNEPPAWIVYDKENNLVCVGVNKKMYCNR